MKITKKALTLALTLTLLLTLSTLPSTALPNTNSSSSNTNSPWPETYIPAQLLIGMETPAPTITTTMFPGLEIETIQDLTDVSAILPNTANGSYTGRQILLLELTSEEETDMLAAIAVAGRAGWPGVCLARWPDRMAAQNAKSA